MAANRTTWQSLTLPIPKDTIRGLMVKMDRLLDNQPVKLSVARRSESHLVLPIDDGRDVGQSRPDWIAQRRGLLQGETGRSSRPGENERVSRRVLDRHHRQGGKEEVAH